MSVNITAQDCEIILQQYLHNQNFELLNYSNKPLSGLVRGNLGDHRWLTIEYKSDSDKCSATFFMKTQPFHNQFQLEFSKEIGAFENEIFFFSKLIPEFKLYQSNFDDSFIPKYYLSKENNVVITEDCNENGFKMAEIMDDLNHMKPVLKSLAKLHAASIIYEEKKSEKIKKPYRLIDDFKEYFYDETHCDNENTLDYHLALIEHECVFAIIDLIPESEDLTRAEFKQKFIDIDNKLKLVNSNNQHRNVCCHGDTSIDNMMFKYENGEPKLCKLIDFQLLRYHPPITDVLDFIYPVTTSKFRHEHMKNLIDFYHKHLCEEIQSGGVSTEIISYDDMMESVDQCIPIAIFMTAYYYTSRDVDTSSFKNIMTHKEKYDAFVQRCRQEIIDQYNTEDSPVKFFLDEIMAEVKDVILKFESKEILS